MSGVIELEFTVAFRSVQESWILFDVFLVFCLFVDVAVGGAIRVSFVLTVGVSFSRMELTRFP